MPLSVHFEAPRARSRARSPSRGTRSREQDCRREGGTARSTLDRCPPTESARHPLKAGACPGSPDPGVARSLKSRAVCEQSCAVRAALLGCGGSARGSKERVEKALEGRNAQESTAAPVGETRRGSAARALQGERGFEADDPRGRARARCARSSDHREARQPWTAGRKVIHSRGGIPARAPAMGRASAKPGVKRPRQRAQGTRG